MSDKIITCSCGQKNRIDPKLSDPKCGSCGNELEQDWFGVGLVLCGMVGCAGVFLVIVAGFLWKFIQWAFLH